MDTNELNEYKYMPVLKILGTVFKLKDSNATDRLDLLQSDVKTPGSILHSIYNLARDAKYLVEERDEYVKDEVPIYDALHYIKFGDEYVAADRYTEGDTYHLEHIVETLTIKDAFNRLKKEIGNDYWDAEGPVKSLKQRMTEGEINIEDLQYLVDLLNGDVDRGPDAGNERGVGAGLASVKYNIHNLAQDGTVTYTVNKEEVTTTLGNAVRNIQIALEAVNKGQFKVVDSVDDIDLNEEGLGYIYLVSNKLSNTEVPEGSATNSDEANNYLDEYIVVEHKEEIPSESESTPQYQITYSYELIGSTRVHLVGYATESWVYQNAKDAIYESDQTIKQAIDAIKVDIIAKVTFLQEQIDAAVERIDNLELNLGTKSDTAENDTAFGRIAGINNEIGSDDTEGTIKGRITELEGKTKDTVQVTEGLSFEYDKDTENLTISWGTATVIGKKDSVAGGSETNPDVIPDTPVEPENPGTDQEVTPEVKPEETTPDTTTEESVPESNPDVDTPVESDTTEDTNADNTSAQE